MKKVLFAIIIIFLLVAFGFITINPVGWEKIDQIKNWFTSRDWQGLFNYLKDFFSAHIGNLLPEHHAVATGKNFQPLAITFIPKNWSRTLPSQT